MDIIKLQQKIVPEIVELLEKRYIILRTIYYNQPIGRRILANKINLGERIVRTEIAFLKQQNLIDIDTPGMTVTKDGEEIVDKLKDYIHQIRGLSDIENILKEKLKLKDVIIVPGDIDSDITVMKELGRAAAQCLKSCLINGEIIALTGGSSVRETVDNMPKITTLKDTTVVPARGGMGKDVETQANTLVSTLACKLGCNYKFLHISDNLSSNAIDTIINEKSIKEVLDVIHKADVLVYGIGRADVMGRRRGLSEDKINKLKEIGAVGEAFGYYFNNSGDIVFSSPTIGMQNYEIKKIKKLIAIAGGSKKAEAILSIELQNENSILITDEGAAREILKKLNNLTI